MTTISTKPVVKNRRQFVRIPAHCKLTAQKILFAAKADTETLGEARNIGAGGLMFVAACDYHKDEMFKMTISIPRWKKHHPQFLRVYENDVEAELTAVCQVTRTRQMPDGTYEVGARFVNIYEDDRVGLQRFVDAEAQRMGMTSE
jgi:c-di-GMP-binding flagellar brake protein YcgR